MTIKGQIESVEIKTGKSPKGSWKRWAYKIGDKSYSTFDAKIGDKFKVGDNVSIDGEQDGQYFNMKSMVLIDSTDNSNSELAKLKPNNFLMVDRESFDKRLRLACLKTSIDYLHTEKLVGTDVVMRCADLMYNWVNKVPHEIEVSGDNKNELKKDDENKVTIEKH